jgi:hypothetical protein
MMNLDLVTNSSKSTAVTGVSNQKSNLAKKTSEKLLACPDHSSSKKGRGCEVGERVLWYSCPVMRDKDSL